MQTATHQRLWTLTNAYVSSRCLHVVADLGVADHIGDEPVAVEELARAVGADADALDRVLSLLAAEGIFRREDGAFGHTPESEQLRSDHPVSMRAFARMNVLPFVDTVFCHLERAVRTGEPTVSAIEPGGLWAYLEDRPDEARLFAEAMSARVAADIAAVLDAYDFTRFEAIADVGGGRGHLLQAVLDAAPQARGLLIDLPPVLADDEIRHDRMERCAADFFADPLPAADAYVLMEILHDWTDDDCMRILGAVRASATAGARVLVIEDVLAERGADTDGHALDVLMLAVTGGRERTPTELARLFERAGFSFAGLVETASRLRIAEAIAI